MWKPNLLGITIFMCRNLLLILAVYTVFLVACTPTPSAEELAITYVAATEEFTTAVAEAVTTGIAATVAAQPTHTPTNTPTRTPIPTTTLTSTPTETLVPTETREPTATGTPEPTETATPSAADIKVGQLYGAIRNLKYFAEQLAGGLDTATTGYLSCSRELRDSVVTNIDKIRTLPTFDDAMFSSRAIGANINYRTAIKTILENENITKAYNHCVTWIDAGKPENFESDRGDLNAATIAARRAVVLAEQALNN